MYLYSGEKPYNYCTASKIIYDSSILMLCPVSLAVNGLSTPLELTLLALFSHFVLRFPLPSSVSQAFIFVGPNSWSPSHLSLSSIFRLWLRPTFLLQENIYVFSND